MAALEFYFDFRSPYADLAQSQGEEMFFGNDRLDFVRASLERAA